MLTFNADLWKVAAHQQRHLRRLAEQQEIRLKQWLWAEPKLCPSSWAYPTMPWKEGASSGIDERLLSIRSALRDIQNITQQSMLMSRGATMKRILELM